MPSNLKESTLVMKFGGASLATIDQFTDVAKRILSRSKEFNNLVVVVSAMGQMTNELITLAKQVNPSPPKREYDMLISIGERMSMALLAMAIANHNKKAISLTGSQSGIITSSSHVEAKIIDVRPFRILESLQAGNIVIVAGFQGVSTNKEITTLGRGGSDTTAVALASALNAEKVEFYKDVPGIFSKDPKKNPTAIAFEELTYEEALELTAQGNEFLHKRALQLAQKNAIPLHVLSFAEKHTAYKGTHITTKGKERPKASLFEQLAHSM